MQRRTRYTGYTTVMVGALMCVLMGASCQERDTISDTSRADDTGDPALPADSDLPGTDSATSSDDVLVCDMSDEPYISTVRLHTLLLEACPQLLLLNVSDEVFYDLGHIPGSLAIPWDSLSERLDAIPGDTHIIVYCRRGVRSQSAAQTLLEAGYSEFHVLDGGIEAWIDAGYETVSESIDT